LKFDVGEPLRPAHELKQVKSRSRVERRAAHLGRAAGRYGPVVKRDGLVLSNISRLREAAFDTPSNLLAICNA
jgi:hypothetical protein